MSETANSAAAGLIADLDGLANRNTLALRATSRVFEVVEAGVRVRLHPVGAGVAHGFISDALIAKWAGSRDRWLRRTAVVSTVALNMKSDGGRGRCAAHARDLREARRGQ